MRIAHLKIQLKHYLSHSFETSWKVKKFMKTNLIFNTAHIALLKILENQIIKVQ